MSPQLEDFWKAIEPLMDSGKYVTSLGIINKLPSVALKQKYQYKASQLLSRLFKESDKLEKIQVKAISFKSRYNYRAQNAYRLKQTQESQLTLL